MVQGTARSVAASQSPAGAAGAGARAARWRYHLPTLSPPSDDMLDLPVSASHHHHRPSLFDSCHRKIRLIGGGPVAFLGGLVAKARRKEREGGEGGGGAGAGGAGGAGGGDPKLYLQEALLERKLPELDMRQLVELPHGLDYNEWLASHTLALFDHVNLVYGTVSEFCTPASCPDMAGPGGRQYAWYDERGKKCRLAAPHYVDYVMTYTQKTINDETVFPTKYANEFPAGFEGVVRRVLRLLFHVVAHMYAAHFRQLALLRLHAHLHLTFAHLTALDARFRLLDHKETEVLRDLEVALRLTEATAGGAGAGAGGEAAADADSPRRAPPSPPAPPPAPAPVVTQPLAAAATAPATAGATTA